MFLFKCNHITKGVRTEQKIVANMTDEHFFLTTFNFYPEPFFPVTYFYGSVLVVWLMVPKMYHDASLIPCKAVVIAFTVVRIIIFLISLTI